MILNEQQVNDWWKEKREAWARDKQAILEGKLMPEDMSLADQIMRGPKRQFDFTKLEEAIKDDDWDWLDE